MNQRQALPHRRFAVTALTAFVAAVACAIVGLALVPHSQRFGALMGAIVIGNTVGTACMAWRAWRRRDERRGWLLMTASGLGMVAMNLVMLRLGRGHWVPGTFAVVLYFSGHLSICLLQVLAILALPWQPEAGRPSPLVRARRLLSSLLFPASLLLVVALGWAWEGGLPRLSGDSAMTFFMAVRVAVIGGLLGHRLVQWGGRIHGPMGWLYLYTLLHGVGLLLLQASTDAAVISAPYGFMASAPVLLVLMGLDPRPVDPGPSVVRGAFATQVIVHLPLLLVGGVFVATLTARVGGPWAPMAVFLFQCGLLAAMLLLALKELALLNQDLERRVEQRTRALEDAQGVLLRTERINSVALLGSGVVHDLNNLHHVMMVTSDVLAMGAKGGRPAEPFLLANLKEAASKAHQLTQNLLALGRAQADGSGACDLALAAPAAANLLTATLPRRVRLAFAGVEGPLPVALSALEVEQVVLNLVVNARDAVGLEGEIQVSLERRAGEAVLAVADNGSGMTREVAERAFDPLYTTKPEGKGTGLGLPSVRALAERAGGRVELRTAPGAGTTFRVILPISG